MELILLGYFGLMMIIFNTNIAHFVLLFFRKIWLIR